MQKLLTTRQVAKVLGVSELETVYSYIREGKLKAYKIGGSGKSKRHWRIRETDLEAFVNGV